MLYKSTLKLLLVELKDRELLIPIVTNSYKKTLWLLKHRAPEAIAIGVVEGPYHDINFMHIGEISIPTLHSQILRTTNAIYTAIGKQPILPDTFDLDFTLELPTFIMQYSNMFTPDELLVVLGISHHKLFKTVGHLVVDKQVVYIPENGPGKWSFYDYYWLTEKYKGNNAKDLDIKPYINRPNLQIKMRAHSVGFSTKVTKKVVSSIDVTLNEEVPSYKEDIILSDVQRDYMISQISDIIGTILNKEA